MEAAGTCEIARLPEELFSAALALTSPGDACRAAAVSRDFHAAAGSDAVWSRFLPRDLPPLADGELSGPEPPSEKGRFLRLCDRPVLLADGIRSMWLDRETGAKCYMLSPRALHTSWSDTAKTGRWAHLPGYRTANRSDYGLCYPRQEASITVAGSTSTRRVSLQSCDSEHEDGAVRHGSGHPRDPVLPRERIDGWMELEMGQFYNKDGDDGEVRMSLTETKGSNVKKGLVVQGIEIRPNRSLNYFC